ncbi:MAG: polysaccharide biosynthesis C-terminal domain-containing protein [Acidimicrobiia bacterium]|nr:polysaccharide biosynthesis C-terminal domain-containing protein [Acidimicrobiia bacterium]
MAELVTGPDSGPGDASLDGAGAASAARGGVLTLIGTFAGAIANFAMLAVVGTYGADVFGTFSGITAFFLVVTMVTRLGSDMGGTWAVSGVMARRSRREAGGVVVVALAPVIAFSILVALALALASGPIAAALSDGATEAEFAAMLRIAVFAVPIATVGETLLGLTRGFGTMRPTIVASQLGRQVGQLVTVLAAVAVSRDLRLLALAWVLPYVGTVVYPALWLRRVLADRTPGAARPWRAFWGYSGPQAANQSAQIGLEKFDIIILGPLTTVAAQGAYNAANRLAHLVVLAWYAINLAHGPVWARLFAGGRRSEVSRSAAMVSGWSVLLVGPLLWSFLVFSRTWTGLLGDELAPGGPALAVLACGLLVALVLGPCENLLLMAGGSTRSFLNNLVALGLNIGLNLVLIPRYGITGAATAWVLALLTVRVLAFVELRVGDGVSSWSSAVVHAWLVVAVASGGSAALVRAVLGDGIGPLVIAGLIGAGAALGVAWWRRDVFHLELLVGSLLPRGVPPVAEPPAAVPVAPVPAGTIAPGADADPAPGADAGPVPRRRTRTPLDPEARAVLLRRAVGDPHLSLRIRSRASIALPASPSQLALLFDAVPPAGWRGRLARWVLARLGMARPQLAARLPFVERTPRAPLTLDLDLVAEVLVEAVERLGQPVDGVLWLLPPASSEPRLGALLLHRDAPVAHLRMKVDKHRGRVPHPLVARGERTGVEWPLVLDRWQIGTARCELTTVVALGRHRPAHPSIDEVVAIADDVAASLGGPRRIGSSVRSPMHGDFTPWNLRAGSGRVALFDWEHASYGPPHADLIRYLTTLRRGVALFEGLPAERRAAAVDAIEYWAGVARRRVGKNQGQGWREREHRRELSRLAGMARRAAAAAAAERLRAGSDGRDAAGVTDPTGNGTGAGATPLRPLNGLRPAAGPEDARAGRGSAPMREPAPVATTGSAPSLAVAPQPALRTMAPRSLALEPVTTDATGTTPTAADRRERVDARRGDAALVPSGPVEDPALAQTPRLVENPPLAAADDAPAAPSQRRATPGTAAGGDGEPDWVTVRLPRAEPAASARRAPRTASEEPPPPEPAGPVRLLDAVHRFSSLVAALTLAGMLVGSVLAWSAPLSRTVSSELLLRDPWGVDPTVTETPVGGDFERFARAQASFLGSDAVLAPAASALALDVDVLDDSIRTEVGAIGGIVTVRSTAADDAEAARRLQAVIDAYRVARRAALTEAVGSELAVIEGARSPEASPELARQAAELRLEAAAYGDGVELVRSVGITGTSTADRLLRGPVLGLAVGLTAGALLAWWLASRRQVVGGPLDPARTLGLRFLGELEGGVTDRVDHDHLVTALALGRELMARPARRGGVHKVVVTGPATIADVGIVADRLAAAAAQQGSAAVALDGVPLARPGGVAQAAAGRLVGHDVVLLACPSPQQDAAGLRLAETADAVVLVVPHGVGERELADVVGRFRRIDAPPLSYVTLR